MIFGLDEKNLQNLSQNLLALDKIALSNILHVMDPTHVVSDLNPIWLGSFVDGNLR